MGLPFMRIYLNSRPMCRITQTIVFEKGTTNQICERRTSMKKLKYYIFCIKWLWRNREWENTRQKFKAMDKAYRKEMVGKQNDR